jgi:hypothetical protein
MLDTLLVALIVSLAAFHVARRYLPRVWRRRTAASASVAAPGCASACPSCNGCGSAKRDR